MPPSEGPPTEGEAAALHELRDAAHGLVDAARRVLDSLDRLIDDPTVFDPAARRVADGLAVAWQAVEDRRGRGGTIADHLRDQMRARR